MKWRYSSRRLTMKKWKLIWGLVGFTILFSSAFWKIRTTLEIKTHWDAHREDVFAAVLEAGHLQGTVFVLIDGREPRASFLRRFAGIQSMRVKGGGHLKEYYPSRGMDLRTKERGVVIRFGEIDWVSSSECKVRGALCLNSNCSWTGEGEFTAKKYENGWYASFTGSAILA